MGLLLFRSAVILGIGEIITLPVAVRSLGLMLHRHSRDGYREKMPGERTLNLRDAVNLYIRFQFREAGRNLRRSGS